MLMGDIFAQRKAKIRTKLIVGTRVSSFISFNLCVKERKGKETPLLIIDVWSAAAFIFARKGLQRERSRPAEHR